MKIKPGLATLAITLLSLAAATTTQAEDPPGIEWQKSFGGSGSDALLSLQLTSDGGYILGGGSSSEISDNKTSAHYGSVDFWLIKLDGSGNKIWEKSFGGSSADIMLSLQQTSDGGYILGGESWSEVSGNKTTPNYGSNDFWVIKLDGTGNKIWEESFGGPGRDSLYSLQQTSDGGYILGGESNSEISGNKTSPNYGNYDYWVIKLDSTGNKIWEQSFGGSGKDSLFSLQQTSDGGYILGGESSSGVSTNKTSPNYGFSDYWVIKLDDSGNKIWEKSFGGSSGDSLSSLQQTSDGGYILGGDSPSGVSGNKTSSSHGSYDFWVIKLDDIGNKLWEKSFGGSNPDYLSNLQQTTDGGYILGGYSRSSVSGIKTSPDYGSSDSWMIKLDGTGNKLWEKSFGGSGSDQITRPQQTSDGGYILGCVSYSGVSGNKTSPDYGMGDYWVIKLSEGVPSINQEPQSQSIFFGESANFSVVATGPPPLVYQWRLEFGPN